MGVRQSFVRITAEQLAELEQIAIEHSSLSYAEISPQLYQVLDRRSHLQQYTMVPLDKLSPEQAYYKFTIEKSYWSLLEDLMVQLIRDQVVDWWPIHEDYPVHIGDLWPCYSYIYLIFHHELAPLLDLLQHVPYEQLKQAFDADFAEFTDMTVEEKQGVYNVVLSCLDSIRIMAQQAHAANESIIWYIS
ncbi:MAG TPA: hypothetical protein DEF47_21610 [Herpetosiphon sp.]|uniref:DUF1877 family protein n=1 Tax=Herpetosiphon aurantiacus (strain ATCC 23779 / DSM 785 / 114-95) TaxID=316274 RepID=A9AX05_HERA2|nr:hypothetical protein [Herpetosiphon sp.]ABX04813.1 hypothetical protein Haur_2173 [Herpetosiphon aurantiacus DSM 785]HBW52489.1 hypothetical protein [Herpetosiphon sp.]